MNETKYFIILYRKGKFGSYKFCYNEGTSIAQVRDYWARNERDYEICNIKQVPDDMVEKFKKFISKKKTLRFQYNGTNGYKFLKLFNVNFWS